MIAKNPKLVETLPDVPRDSGVFRVTRGAPLSRHLDEDAARVSDMALDLIQGGMSTGQIAARLHLLSQRLRGRASLARGIEDVCWESLEDRRHV